MRSLHPAFPVTVVSLLLLGCASTEPSPDSTAPPTELVYRTGSHIPIRDAQPMTKEEREKQAEESRRALQQMQTTGAGNPKIN